MSVTKQTNTTLAEIADVIKSHGSFLIAGHVGPDGDCIGSQLALAHVLNQLGKEVTVTLPSDEPVDSTLVFLPGAQLLTYAEKVHATSWDVFVGVDVPTRERLGESVAALKDLCARSITIDHHAVDTTMCDYVYVDPDVASTSMLIWTLAKLLSERPPVECAQCAYTGLVTDTGCFQFQNVNHDAFIAAADLVSAGADPALTARETMHNRTEASVRLEERIINRMEFFSDGKCVLSWVTKADMQACKAVKSDTDPLINTLRQIQGVRVACVLREQDDVVKGSLRAKDDTDVATIAQSFGGGGHKAAAGFTMYDSIDNAVATLRATLSSL